MQAMVITFPLESPPRRPACHDDVVMAFHFDSFQGIEPDQCSSDVELARLKSFLRVALKDLPRIGCLRIWLGRVLQFYEADAASEANWREAIKPLPTYRSERSWAQEALYPVSAGGTIAVVCQATVGFGFARWSSALERRDCGFMFVNLPDMAVPALRTIYRQKLAELGALRLGDKFDLAFEAIAYYEDGVGNLLKKLGVRLPDSLEMAGQARGPIGGSPRIAP